MKKLIVLLGLGLSVMSCSKEASYEIIAESNMAIEMPKVTTEDQEFFCADITGCGTNKVSVEFVAEDHELITITNLPGQFTVTILRKGKEVEPHYFGTGANYRHK